MYNRLNPIVSDRCNVHAIYAMCGPEVLGYKNGAAPSLCHVRSRLAVTRMLCLMEFPRQVDKAERLVQVYRIQQNVFVRSELHPSTISSHARSSGLSSCVQTTLVVCADSQNDCADDTSETTKRLPGKIYLTAMQDLLNRHQQDLTIEPEPSSTIAKDLEI